MNEESEVKDTTQTDKAQTFVHKVMITCIHFILTYIYEFKGRN